jgi:hypothetical protein
VLQGEPALRNTRPPLAGDARPEARVTNAILIPLALTVGAIALSSSACAAGIDSRGYSCADLQALITAKRFVFINNPNFGDFVVADASYCGGGGSARLVRRSVPTTDNPECLVNYCTITNITPGGGG